MKKETLGSVSTVGGSVWSYEAGVEHLLDLVLCQSCRAKGCRGSLVELVIYHKETAHSTFLNHIQNLKSELKTPKL